MSDFVENIGDTAILGIIEIAIGTSWRIIWRQYSMNCYLILKLINVIIVILIFKKSINVMIHS